MFKITTCIFVINMKYSTFWSISLEHFVKKSALLTQYCKTPGGFHILYQHILPLKCEVNYNLSSYMFTLKSCHVINTMWHYWIQVLLPLYLAWPFTILQIDNITISWDFFQADSTKVSKQGCWCFQPEKISWYCNIIIL